ncbi:MAG TPA: fluoride efflux transporter CrcB [Mycobacteriales bacterium]|jgi:CrcB protein|nr:fluoride efflux transporter CrcB [Mycobacteriales bacterium]
MNYLLVALAGGVGAPMRYLVDIWVQRRTARLFPWGTFAINVTGSLLLGFVTGLALFHGFPDTPKLLIGTGFCGAYTTFSTFTFESVRLGQERAARQAIGNVVGSVVLGLGAAALGLLLAAS